MKNSFSTTYAVPQLTPVDQQRVTTDSSHPNNINQSPSENPDLYGPILYMPYEDSFY